MTFTQLFNADVAIEREIPYRESSDHARHRLDVYAPPDADMLPVVIFFYGGGWRSGDKRLFEHLGRAFAVRGILAVTVNYRLTPEISHPDHARDCAAAVSWVYRNIDRYGGDRRKLVLVGHSAGAHLAALLGTDDRYLAGADVPSDAIVGVVTISGVYDLRSHAESPGFTSLESIHQAFGASQSELGSASPIIHLREGLPPFLVIVAENDPERMREQGRSFVAALRDVGDNALFLSVRGRDHFSIVRRFGPSDDATAESIAGFVKHLSRGTDQSD